MRVAAGIDPATATAQTRQLAYGQFTDENGKLNETAHVLIAITQAPIKDLFPDAFARMKQMQAAAVVEARTATPAAQKQAAPEAKPQPISPAIADSIGSRLKQAIKNVFRWAVN